MKKLKFNLGCGIILKKELKKQGWIGVDKDIKTKPDIVFDLESFPWTFAKDNSVDEIMCSHFIEHLDKFYEFFNECHRILKPGGMMYITSPYYTSIRCWQDATHKKAISESTFLYFNKEWRKQVGVRYYPITAEFNVIKIDYNINQDWRGKSQDAIVFALKHYWNVADDILVTLQKPKQ